MPAGPPPIKPQPSYFATWNFVTKLLQLITSIVIVAVSSAYHGKAQIYVCSIVSAVGIILALMWIVLYAINLNARFPKFFDTLLLAYHVIMFACYAAIAGCAFSLFEVDVFIVAGVMAVVAAVTLLVDIMLNISWMRGMEDENELTPIRSNSSS